MAQAWLIAGSQDGPPPVQQAAWLLDVPEGSDASTVAAQFATDQGFPIGTRAHVIDLSADPLVIQVLELTSQWASP